MKFTQKILLIFLIAFAFIGNIGVNVFTHTCKKDGNFHSFYVKTQTHCSDHLDEKLPPCCKKEVVKDDDCCKDEIEVFKIKLDFFSNYLISVPFFYFEATEQFNIAKVLRINGSNQFAFNHYRPPPNKDSKQIILFYQVFRI